MILVNLADLCVQRSVGASAISNLYFEIKLLMIRNSFRLRRSDDSKSNEDDITLEDDSAGKYESLLLTENIIIVFFLLLWIYSLYR